MATHWFIEQVGDFFQTIQAHEGPRFQQLVAETEGLEGQIAFTLQFGPLLAPQTVSAETLGIRDPYTNPQVYSSRLASLAESGWVELAEDGYKNSPKGEQVAQKMFATLAEIYENLTPLSTEKTERIATLIKRVVDAARTSDDPPGNWCINMGRNVEPLPDAPAMFRARRFIVDMNAFRDDAHLGAWKGLGVNGSTWEAFSFIWNGDATNAEELAEKLQFRGWDQTAYQAMLKELCGLGWIMLEDGKYQATEKGKAIRENVEDRTNEYFNAPWNVLTNEETEELKTLIGQLIEGLKPPDS